MERGAIFDPTGIYRYLLWRQWASDRPAVCFVMLNPSTADAIADDPTIRRCIRFAQTWGSGSLFVVNLFAYRATHPKKLQQAPDPIGPDNDRYLSIAHQQARTTIAAWGNKGRMQQRDRAVLRLFQGQELHCLGTTQHRQPRHPLYLNSNTPLIPFTPPLQTSPSKSPTTTNLDSTAKST